MDNTDVTMVQEDNKPGQIIVNYELDTITNLKKAKTNLKRSKEFSRKVTDDTNIRYEIHPAVYLEVKNKAKTIRRGTEIEDEEIGIKVKVTNTRSTKTKVKLEEPEFIIWYDITDVRSGLVTRCTQKMYHTKQSIHLQGGQRIGKTTTSALVADYLEKEWNEIKEEKKSEIEYNTEVLANINITKLQNDRRNKPSKAQAAKPKYDCTDCDFKSIFKWEIKRHVRISHNLSINFKPTKRPATSPSNTIKVKKVLKLDENKVETLLNVSRSSENDKDEYIDNLNTPTTSPIKKKTKVNVDTEKSTNESSVEVEVSSVIQNLESAVKVKDERIKYVESENQQLLNKINIMRGENDELKEAAIKKDQELGLIQVEYDSVFKAAKKMEKDKGKVEEDYKEAATQLNLIQKRNEMLSETLKVTEEILKAQEEEEEDEEDIEEENQTEHEENKQKDDDDDEDYLEDEDEPGKLWQVAQRKYKCKECDEKVAGSQQFKEHIQTHIKDQEQNLACFYCDFNTKNGNIFINHMASVHGGDATTCLTCKKTFNTKEEMINHVLMVHKMKASAKVKCVTCNEEFVKVEHLTEHILRKHTMLTSEGQANVAGNQLIKLWPLQGSVNNRNQNQSAKQCYDCGNTFNNHMELMGHKQEKHYKQKLCHNFHYTGDCRFGEQCLDIHEDNHHMNRNHMQYQERRSHIMCRNGPNCDFKAQSRCRYSHIATNVNNVSRTSQISNNTNVFNMHELLASLGARLERVEQQVPDLRSMEVFPTVQEGGTKKKTA